MRKTLYTAGYLGAALAAVLLPLAAGSPPSSPREKAKPPLLGRLFDPAGARIVVRREECSCDPIAGQPDVQLLTVGAESGNGSETTFHPLAMFAFDRSLNRKGPGQWLAFWIFGPRAAGPGRNLAAWTPVPAGSPGVSKGRLKRMKEALAELRAGTYDVRPPAPKPFLDLTEAGRFPQTSGLTGMLKRYLGWINFNNPGQIVYRSYLTQRRDRHDRDFQRAIISLYWLLDSEAYRHEESEWLEAMNDLKFHLIRTRSPWGRFLSAGDAWDLVLGYEGSVREFHGKNSAWMHSAANEHYLRYEPIYRYAENGRSSPMAGVLYYDPRIPNAQDPGWWHISNPFDLTYNPHKNPEVQRLSREHPDELIPLAVYTYQTELGLRPIITIDFFDPGNPRVRERNQYLMTYLGHLLKVVTGALSLQRLPYQVVNWAANKKGLTLLTTLSSRMGVEELRMSLEAGLYFREDALAEMLQQADQRNLNPLVRTAAEHRVRAALQYESLLTDRALGLCRQVGRIRRTLMERFGISPKTQRVERRRQLAHFIKARQQVTRLRTLARRATNDYGSLENLSKPLEYFQTAKPPFPPKLLQVLGRTYQELYEAELAFPESQSPPEVLELKVRAREVWERIAGLEGIPDFAARATKREARSNRRFEKRRRKARKRQAADLRVLLQESRKELRRAAAAGCDPNRSAPADVESHLVLLREAALAASSSEILQAELDRQRFDLKEVVRKVEARFISCPAPDKESWRAGNREVGRDLARALLDVLDGKDAAKIVEGGN